jgi:RNA polymerase sigma-70 factor, ECF subfamily
METRDEIERLIARVALGDRRAFDALYAATSAKLFGVTLRILDNRAEAEDTLQEVYVRIWHNAGRYQVNGLSPMTWLITVARNLAIDRLRARRASQPIDEAAELADLTPGPEALAIAASERGRIAHCLGELDPDRAEAVRRAYVEGESYNELAARFGLPLNTVRTWLRRSLLKLREHLSS